MAYMHFTKQESDIDINARINSGFRYTILFIAIVISLCSCVGFLQCI